MAFINSDGSEATKDMGQMAIENDGSAQGVTALSLKEGLGRRANRLGAGAHASSGNAGVAIVNTGLTQVCQTALSGGGMRQHVIAVSLLALGGATATDFTQFQISYPMDDGTHVHTVYLPAGGSANLVLETGGMCTAQNGQVTISARSSSAAGQTAFAGVLAVNLPN